MNNIYYFLRHAETKVDTKVHATLWVLSELGRKQSMVISDSGVFDEVEIIISSSEVKAYQTAQPIGLRLGKKVIMMDDFRELGRGDKYLTKDEFERLKRAKLEDLDCNYDNGETGRKALKRFISGINKLEIAYHDKKILIVSHGTVLSLYFAKIKNEFANIFQRWQGLGFCSWGNVDNIGKIVKDIV